MRFLQILFVLLLTVLSSDVFARSVTFYLDGARVEREVVAVKGYLEMQLPPGMEPGSLRVRPLHGASLARVEVAPALPNRKVDTELAGLTERRDILADRLQARPLMGFHQPSDVRRDGSRACLDTAMIGVDNRLGRGRFAGGIVEEQNNIMMKRRLIAL